MGTDKPTTHQGALFGLEEAAPAEGVGYRGPTACSAAGITYRQLDYWARTALVEVRQGLQRSINRSPTTSAEEP